MRRQAGSAASTQDFGLNCILAPGPVVHLLRQHRGKGERSGDEAPKSSHAPSGTQLIYQLESGPGLIQTRITPQFAALREYWIGVSEAPL